MSHEPENLISAYLDGQLSPGERARFEERMQQDEQLRALTRELELQSGELRSFPKFSLDTDFADRVLSDVRLDSAFVKMARQATVAKTLPDQSDASEYSVKRGKWKYALGAITSLAALLLLSAFLVFPKSNTTLPLSKKENAETVQPSADIQELAEPTNLGEGGETDSLTSKFSENRSLEDKAAFAKGMDADSEMVDSIEARRPSQDTDRRQFADASKRNLAKPDLAVKSVPGEANEVQKDLFKDDAFKQKFPMEELSEEPMALKSQRKGAADTIDQSVADALHGLEADDDDAPAESQNQLEAEQGNVIEVVFADPDREFLAFKQSLIQNNITVAPHRRSSPAGRKSTAMNTDGISIASGGTLGFQAAESQQVYLIEATEQQFQKLLLDLNKLATVTNRRLPMGAAEASTEAELLDSGVTDIRTQREKAVPDVSRKLAIAREMDLKTALRLAKLGQRDDRVLNQSNKIERFSKQKAANIADPEALRKMVFVLQNAQTPNSRVAPAADASEK